MVVPFSRQKKFVFAWIKPLKQKMANFQDRKFDLSTENKETLGRAIKKLVLFVVPVFFLEGHSPPSSKTPQNNRARITVNKDFFALLVEMQKIHTFCRKFEKHKKKWQTLSPQRPRSKFCFTINPLCGRSGIWTHDHLICSLFHLPLLDGPVGRAVTPMTPSREFQGSLKRTPLYRQFLAQVPGGRTGSSIAFFYQDQTSERRRGNHSSLFFVSSGRPFI